MNVYEFVAYFHLASPAVPPAPPSKVIARYGKGFGLVDRILSKDSIFNQPSSVFAMAFYMMQIFMTITKSDDAIAMQSLVSLLANFGSIYFFYVLYSLQNFCLICISLYIINALILVCVLLRLITLHKQTLKKTH
ncbi:vitamin K epoxide reductase complex subunit 1-like protein 1 isoform X2 [Octopus bimaculoides]|uniref:vitamin K epoxide reductase complex subunit 1-like protein 1 isoform X2 n=1 Tax=Octopus bimaculoides TaxID=37653 RepID=UPI00071E0AFF|nr:vitamin K epoxide reductase complex subunit 1-like protein 1 isoform X2 [Octopus bimaculoides]|eukprot:XP_014771780.1 PREDICTED: vitamin K epoxide reductase complex subunit 1-like protein 1 isoform X2 [Octopus bimaculoides]